MPDQSCPTCGAAVEVIGDAAEGTMHYQPVSDARVREATYREVAVVDNIPDSEWAGLVQAVQAAASLTDDVELSDRAAEDIICAVIRGLHPEPEEA